MNKKFFFIVILLTIVANASAQFSYKTKSCKFTEICPADSNWTLTADGNYMPLSENAQLYQKAERCSGWYVQPGVFAGYTNLSHSGAGSTNSFSPRAEIVAGYDFCSGHGRNVALSVEAKIQLAHMPKLEYKDLTYVKSGYAPTVGANLVLQLSKHKRCQVAVFGGAGYTRLTSYYPHANELTLNKLVHNTVSYEGGIQMLWRTHLGHSIGVKAGYEHVSTMRVGRGQAFVGVVYKFKGAKKSHKMTYAEYYNATHK